MAGLAIIYMINPVDIIPEIPVVGWIDDFFIGSGGVLNLVEGYMGNTTLLWCVSSRFSNGYVLF
ncbi:MAG: DUF1232 domain-containing protein [Capnocytophaga sp.]|nr:DUF1232 domain-containing protein [Capnocytophaga sp.]